MVRAQDETQSLPQQPQQHQLVDPALLKLLQKAEANPSLFELDEIVGWDSPPDTPSSVDSEEDLFANTLRTEAKYDWDTLFDDHPDLVRCPPTSTTTSTATSASCSSASSTSTSPSLMSSVMWNFDLPMSHLEIIEPEASISCGTSVLAQSQAAHANSFDFDFSRGLEMDVFGLDSAMVSVGGIATTLSSAPVSAASAATSATATTASAPLTKSAPSTKPLCAPVARVLLDSKKKPVVGDKRKSEDDSLEAKKARARQTRDEIVAKTQAALLKGCKTDNPEMRRITHNVLERKRREDLKTSYQELRSFVPEVMHNDRAPTGQILGKAVDYIHALRAEEQELMQKIATMRAENERLRSRVL